MYRCFTVTRCGFDLSFVYLFIFFFPAGPARVCSLAGLSVTTCEAWNAELTSTIKVLWAASGIKSQCRQRIGS